MADFKRDRVVWLDCFKAVGILAIVFFHAGIDVGVLSCFFVPMFYFASGFTYKNAGIQLCKKIRRLYIPFLLVNLIHVLLHNPLYLSGIYSDPVDMAQIVRGGKKFII